MHERMATGRVGQTTQGTRRRVRNVLAVIVVVIAVVCGGWLVAGSVRTNSIARDYFAHAHGGATVTNVTVESVSPAVPPFWEVKISGDVVESGRTTPAYRSYMILWIEPVTGSVIVNGAG